MSIICCSGRETVEKIINALELSPAESASLFNVNISKELHNIIDITTLININDINETINEIVNKINKIFSTEPVVLWLWDEKSNCLRLNSSFLPSIDATVAQNIFFDEINSCISFLFFRVRICDSNKLDACLGFTEYLEPMRK